MNAHPSNTPVGSFPSSKIKSLLIAVIGVGLCAFVVCCVGFLIARNFTGESLPVYAMDQVPSAHAGYLRTTLTNGNTVYVRDYEEYALISANTEPPEMIGQLPFSEDSVSGVYAIPGQDPSAYVLEYDPMYQAVYRNIEHPPLDWRSAEFQKLRLMAWGNAKDTTDVQVIQDFLNTLKEGEFVTLSASMPQDGIFSGYENYAVILFSEQLPGLMVAFGLHIDQNGKVYLAENFISNQWVTASPFFVEWMNK